MLEKHRQDRQEATNPSAPLRTDSKLLLYAWLIHEMLPVLEAYRTEKRERRQAFSDDQLMLARDMLRDSTAGASLFPWAP